MRRIALLIAVLAVTSAACGGDEPAPATGSSPEGERGESISVASTAMRRILGGIGRSATST